MVEWLAGNRIRGTSTERTTGAGFNPVIGGWKEVGRHKLTSAGDTIDITSLDNKRYYMVLQNILGSASGEISPEITFNGNNSALYPIVRNNGATSSDNAFVTSYNWLYNGMGGTNSDRFIVGYIANKSDREKLYLHHQCMNEDISDANTAPRMNYTAGKWRNSSDAINRITFTNSGGGDFVADSEVVVLGWDEDDTHTTNFWEELASFEVTGSAVADFDSGAFTAKKYLWVQAYIKSDGGNISPRLRLGSSGTIDSGSDVYATSSASNGGAGSDATARTDMVTTISSLTTPCFINAFIINNTSKHKTVIHQAVHQGTAGVGQVTQRREGVSKWENTSNQCNIVGFHDNDGSSNTNMAAGSIIKVWGSD